MSDLQIRARARCELKTGCDEMMDEQTVSGTTLQPDQMTDHMINQMSQTKDASSHSSISNLMEPLNPPQRDAAETLTGPLLILAGAGSGKTRVLTFRTVNLIAQGLAATDEILAVTFTNKAAKEMEGRIQNLLRKLGIPVYGRLWISTFHSICARILREHIHLLDYKPFFGIYDTSDQVSMIKKVLTVMGIDEKTYPAKAFAARINAAKTEALTPSDVQKRPRMMDEQSRQVYAKYEDEMKRANSLDFADLLMKTYLLYCDYPAVLESYQRKFRFIMVDEYQDTNRIQYLLVRKIADAHRNLCVVGDEDQSIYSWRGADIHNILDFEKDFPEAKVVKLEQNYRSTQTIINAATHVIRNNTQRKDKTLYTENAPGEPIIIREENNEYEEARYVVDQIQRLLGGNHESAGFAATDIAIFYRTNAQSRVLEEQLRTRGIPYKLVGGMKFYERMEIKDILAYMKLILNPSDDVALKRVINVPARGIGKTTVDRLEDFTNARDLSLVEGMALAVDQREFNAGTTSKLRGFLNLLETLRNQAQALTLPELYHAILDGTFYVQRLKEEDSPESENRIENLEEFDNAISKFSEERGEEGTLQTFLEEMALVSDQDALESADEAKTVTMMTLHISKGLEYPVVFIVGMEENLFPSGRAAEENGDPTAIEEERRLAYVGMTRAEKKLTLTYARTRKVWGAEHQNPPSRFLKELPAQGVIQQTSSQRPSFADRMRQQSSRSPSTSKDSSSGSWNNHDKMPSYEDFADQSSDDIFPETGGGDSSSNGSTGASRASELRKGMRVRHPTYGVGAILSTEGSGADLKVSVVFGDNTVKKFVAKYARLEQV
jgi:DNA helicase-2/ATP-dependent DNA helicase PcrA